MKKQVAFEELTCIQSKAFERERWLNAEAVKKDFMCSYELQMTTQIAVFSIISFSNKYTNALKATHSSGYRQFHKRGWSGNIHFRALSPASDSPLLYLPVAMAAAIGSSLITLFLYRGEKSLADIWSVLADTTLRPTFISPLSTHIIISFWRYFHRWIIRVRTHTLW